VPAADEPKSGNALLAAPLFALLALGAGRLTRRRHGVIEHLLAAADKPLINTD